MTALKPLKPFLLLALAACSSPLLGACSPPAHADALAGESSSTQFRRTMTVTGTATLDVTPDTADVSMQLFVEKPRPKAAVTELRARQAKLLKAIEDAGIAKGDIMLGNLTISPAYDEKGNLRGYDAALAVTVSTKNFDLLGDVMEAAADEGTQNLSTSFRISDLTSFRKRVRGMALEAAASKAHEITKALDTSLGRVDSVSESAAADGAATPSYGYYGGYTNYYGYANGMPLANATNSVVRGTADLGPGQGTMTVTMTVTYDLG